MAYSLAAFLFKAIAFASVILNPADAEYYCELFQYPGFKGESLRIPNSHQIHNVSRLTQSWRNSLEEGNNNNKLPPLYSVQIPSQVPCTANGGSLENFEGKCRTLKAARKRIRVSRLLSFSCNCANETEPVASAPVERQNVAVADTTNTNPLSLVNESVRISNEDHQSCLNSAEGSEFKKFSRHGKKIIGVGRNYM